MPAKRKIVKKKPEIPAEKLENQEDEAEISDKEEKAEISGDEAENAEDVEKKQRKTGVVYFSMIPPNYNVARMREYFEKIAPGDVGRIYLAKNKASKSLANRYSEGWMELKKKKVAKAIAEQIDNTQIGGKKRDFVSSLYWNIRYLSGFKWVHLTEQLQYEKEVERRRMNVELAQARRIAAHFEDQIEKGRNLRKLEEKVKSAGGKWTNFERDVEQKKTFARKPKKERKNTTVKTENTELMNMIFQ
ncbi:unnamed protein product [Caenorhabditis angaria]|uniref:Activator of basal transcription 1 n=1 Tax=Caenorhabditis angaria TaxID=860376 RepID=A0A9P1I787_9PELO|nr:unnamed protein product [Caenorhabditis angaria]